MLQARKVPPFINLLPAAKLWLRSGYLPTMKSIVPFQCQLRRHLTTAAMEIYGDPVMDLGGIHKLRLQEEGGRWSKKLTFCQHLYHKKCQQRGVAQCQICVG